jgi:glycine oxidase
MDADVIVVGGGVIGTAIAWRAARAGHQVTLIDAAGPSPAGSDKASLVAAGMLGPVSESVFGEEHLLALNLHAIGRFPSFAAELEAATGLTVGLRTEGTLSVAYDSGDLAALDRLTAFRHGLGLRAQRLDARECRAYEPFLAPSTRGGVLAAGDLSVDNRRYYAALRTAAADAGVRIRAGTVTRVSEGTAVETGPGGTGAGGTGTGTLTARHVVVAAGHGTSGIDGVPEPVRKALRPVKGQILRLRHPKRFPHLLTRTVRAIVHGHDVYLVPRADGELVVGATAEERDDRDVTAGAVHDLLRDALTAVPAVSELILAEASAGLRPGSSDNGPVVGRAADGLIIAAGHFRNGILLSAVTADAVTALLGERGRPSDPGQPAVPGQPAPPGHVWAPFTPGRFA